MNRTVPILLFVLASAACLSAAERERLLLDPGWRFAVGSPDLGDGTKVAAGMSVDLSQNFGAFAKAGSVGGPASADFDDLTWRTVDLPHDWAVEMPFSSKADCAHGCKAIGPQFPSASVAWYRRQFSIPADDAQRRVSVEFDGVFRDSEVYINGHYLGRNFSGYAPASYDISPYLNYGGRNTLAVKVNATAFEGWFYEGAGIYRHAWLVKTSPVHVPQWGVSVTTEVTGDPAKPASATVTTRTTVRNDSDTAAAVTVPARLLSAAGGEVARGVSALVAIAPWSETEVTVPLTVSAPHLWSDTDPYLYTVENTVRVDGKTLDRTVTSAGIRTICFDPDKGFLLNGVRTFLKGTCNHQDHAGVGAAVPDGVNAWRIKQLKAMGCNAYRTSHNPPTPELLDACDRLGMMVMDENRTVGATDEALSQLERMMRRDRNHPSVVIWSLGNEEMGIQSGDTGARILAPMQRLAHRIDPSRPTTIAMNGAWGFGFSNVIDVQGCNYLKLGGGYDNFHKKHPAQPVIGTEEASHTTTRGSDDQDDQKLYCHGDEAKARSPGWASSAEKWWNHYLERPYICGGFAWTGFDYRGEPTPYHRWPSVNSHFGILDTCGFPKDVFYYYQAWWSSGPVLHLLPHWNWPDKVGKPVDVRCDGNAQEVELFVNGASQGKKNMPRNGHIDWPGVIYHPGVLYAKGYTGGNLVSVATIETADAPAAVRMEPDRATLKGDGEDVAMIAVSVVDAKGCGVPTAGNSVSFSLTGPGRILGVGNGDPTCHEPDQYVSPAPSVVNASAWKQQIGTTDVPAAVAPGLDGSAWQKAIGDTKQLSAKGQKGVWRGVFHLTAEQIAGYSFSLVTGRAEGSAEFYWNGARLPSSGGDSGQQAVSIPNAVVGGNVLAVVITAREAKGGVTRSPSLLLTPKGPLPWRRSVFNGLAQVIVQTLRAPGVITLNASSEGLSPAAVKLTVEKAESRPIAQ